MMTTFVKAARRILTTEAGPSAADVKQRIIRDLNKGKIIDMCEPDSTPDAELLRLFESPKTIRVELVLKSAEEMYRRRGPDVAEICSQPRVAVEASMRKYGNRNICPAGA